MSQTPQKTFDTEGCNAAHTGNHAIASPYLSCARFSGDNDWNHHRAVENGENAFALELG